MTDVDLTARAARRGLSVEAYLNQLEASRRWKREHPADARAHWYARCDCGNQMKRGSRQCHECRSGKQACERRKAIQLYWATGMTLREIAAALNSTKSAIGVEMNRMRKDGWDLPYRRVPRRSAA